MHTDGSECPTLACISGRTRADDLAAARVSLRKPEVSRREWAIALLVFLAGIAYLLPFRSYVSGEGDEGIALQGAMRILKGEVPYRDFFTYMTPGSYYLYALLFKLFGPAFSVARMMLVLYGALFSVLTYLLARRVCSRWSSLLAAYLLLVACLPVYFIVVHNWDSTAIAYLAIYSAVWLLTSPKRWLAAVVGLLTALTFLFEQSKGAGLALGLTAAAILLAGWGVPRFSIRRLALPALAGATVPFILTCAYFGYEGLLRDMWHSWLWPLQNYTNVNQLPYASLNLIGHDAAVFFYLEPPWWRRILMTLVTCPFFLIPVLPFGCAAIAFCHSVLLARRTSSCPEASAYYIVMGTCGVGLVLSTAATGRPDFAHLLFVTPMLFPAVAWVIEGTPFRSQVLNASKPVLVVLLLVFFTAFGMIFVFRKALAPQNTQTRRGIVKASRSDLVMPYLEWNVRPGEPMLVYPDYPIYYFLTDTISPISYDYLQIGMHTPDQFDRAKTELQRSRPRVVLYDPAFNELAIRANWPNTPEEALTEDPVRDFILGNYRSCAALPSYGARLRVMWRNDLPCPGGRKAPGTVSEVVHSQ